MLTLATFTQASATQPASAYTATVAWVDGTSDPSTGPNVAIQVTGTDILVKGMHTFTTHGNQYLVITLHGLNDNTTALAFTTIYAASPLSVVSANPFFPEQNVSTRTEILSSATGFVISGGTAGPSRWLAQFTQKSDTQSASAYTATVDWGDGSMTDSSTGPNVTIQAAAVNTNGQTAGIFVFGSHTYAATGTYTLTVTLVGPFGTEVTAHPTANVVLPATLTKVTSGNQMAVFSGSAQTLTFTAQVTSAAGTVNEGTVTVSLVNQSNVTIGQPSLPANVGANGTATGTYTLPANTPTGTYRVVPTYSGGPHFQMTTNVLSNQSSNLTVANFTVDPPALPVSSNPQTVTLSASLAGLMPPANAMGFGFSVGAGQTVPAMVANGIATATYTIAGNTAPGSYSVTLHYT
jgi:hypothetical protein